MNVRSLCLAMLAEAEMTGYEIRKEATEGRYAYFVDASYGSIYPALARLEEEGCVVFREVTSPGKPARKVYSITQKGLASLAEELAQPPAPDIFRSGFLMVGMCRKLVSRETMERAITARRSQIAEEIDRLCLMKAGCGDADVGTRWIIDYGICCKRAALAYLTDHAGALLDAPDAHAHRDAAE